MKVRNKTLVPRNPYAVAAGQKKAGKHDKSNKAKRQESKQQLRQIISTLNDKKGGDFPPFLFSAHPQVPHSPSLALCRSI